MKAQTTLESKELTAIVAKALKIPEAQVKPTRYSVAIEDLTTEEVERRIRELLES